MGEGMTEGSFPNDKLGDLVRHLLQSCNGISAISDAVWGYELRAIESDGKNTKIGMIALLPVMPHDRLTTSTPTEPKAQSNIGGK